MVIRHHDADFGTSRDSGCCGRPIDGGIVVRHTFPNTMYYCRVRLVPSQMACLTLECYLSVLPFPWDAPGESCDVSTREWEAAVRAGPNGCRRVSRQPHAPNPAPAPA